MVSVFQSFRINLFFPLKNTRSNKSIKRVAPVFNGNSIMQKLSKIGKSHEKEATANNQELKNILQFIGLVY